ncbi:MAG TPA: LysR family transcriptional regulator [Eoetvoesiella sp.]
MAETKLLKDLITLSKTGSFTKAAELRNVTHPAFGRRIKELEAWAGTSLVNRQRIPITLTDAGRDLLVVAEHIIAKLNTINEQISRPGDWASRRVRIATGRHLASTLVADWVCRVADQVGIELHSTIAVEIRTGVTQDLIGLMQSGDIDFLCCYQHHSLSVPITTNSYQYLSLSADKLVPVCLNNGQQSSAHYNLEDELTPIPHITYFDSLSLQQIINDHLRSGNYALNQIAHCDSVEVARSLVKKGRGIAWLPWSIVSTDCESGLFKILGSRHNEIPFEVRLYRPKRKLPIAAELAWKRTIS